MKHVETAPFEQAQGKLSALRLASEGIFTVT
jgi:hypothetical protein